MESIPVRRLRGFGVALVLVSAGGVLQAVNMMSTPGRRNAEGILVNRAWLLDADSVSRLTDWYDHPPLGWLMLSLWSSMTGAFERAPSAVGAGRELVLLAQLASGGLLWALARRLGLTRWAAALALVLFGISPLAVQLHRQVSLENLATPWIIAAFVLACSPRRQLIAFAASGACFAAAVLTNEASLVLLPLLVWQTWRTGLPSTRRYGLVVGGSLFLLVCGVYVVGVTLSGELVAGAGHGGLLDGVRFALFDRGSTGSLLDTSWFDLDPVGVTATLLAAPVALVAVPRFRPVAASSLLLAVALALRPDQVPQSLVVTLLPFGALTVAGVVHHARRRWVQSLAAPLAVVAAASVAVAVPLWVDQHRQLVDQDGDAALRQAERWIADNVPAERRLIVDDAMWVELVESGFHPEQVAGYATLAMDPDVGLRPSGLGGWADYRVVVSTASLRALPDTYPQADEALRHSELVAAFGRGRDRVEVRRIVPDGTAGPGPTGATANDANDLDIIAAATAGAALVRNPSIEFAPAARDALIAGEVDERLMTTLVALAVDRELQVSDFPVDPAEAETDAPRRIVEVRAASDGDAHAIAGVLHAQQAPYRPAEVDLGTNGLVTVSYRPAAAI
jgi:hypothetical protein